MKNAILRILIFVMILAALGAAQVAIAGESPPCQGVDQTIGANIKNKADLERAITKQLKVSHPALKISSVSVLRTFASENWSIIYVQPPKLERVFLFYAGNPLTSRYVTEFSDMGMALSQGEPAMKAWVLKNAPGIPPKLASCFAWYVTKGHFESAAPEASSPSLAHLTKVVKNRDKSPSLAHLTQWVGKYQGGFNKTMFEDKAFKPVLIKVLGERRLKVLLSKLTNIEDVEQEGNILVVSVWEPHNAQNHADIFINLIDNSVEVYWCEFNNAKNSFDAYWLSSKNAPRRLILTKNQCWFGAYNRFELFRRPKSFSNP